MLLTLDFFVTKLHHGKNGGGGYGHSIGIIWSDITSVNPE